MSHKKGWTRRLILMALILCVFLLYIPSAQAAVGDAGTDGDFEWEELPDGTVNVTDYSGAGGAVVIPNTLSGKTVSVIGDSAFIMVPLTSITIPDSVTTIERDAFQNCTSLTSVTFPSGLLSIGDSAFDACTSLASVTLPSGLQSIGIESFIECTSLTSITIPSSVTVIGEGAFTYCTRLASVTLNNGLLTIGARAFRQCGSLTEIAIPASVTTIGDYAFGSCPIDKATIYNPTLALNRTMFNEAWFVDGIYGFEGSTAETFAMNQEVWFLPLRTVTFDSQGGSAVASKIAEEGADIDAPTDPTQDGYMFDGWYPTAACDTTETGFPYTVTQDVTLYAKWTPIYTVTFDSQGGSPVSDYTGFLGDIIDAPTDPTYSGYVFDGWYPTAACNTSAIPFPYTVVDDVTLYAKWIPIYTVTFDSQGGSSVSDATAQSGETVDAPTDPTYSGHVFDGWYPTAACDTTETTFPYTVTQDVTLYAKWIPIYTVTFDSQGGSAVSDVTAQSGETVDAPTNPTYSGYVFNGWYPTAACDGTECTFPYTVTQDVTLYAKWIPIYTVTFDSQGGSAVAAKTAAAGSDISGPANPTRENHAFGGWYKTSACDGTAIDFPFTVTADITLYAKWTDGQIDNPQTGTAYSLWVWAATIAGVLLIITGLVLLKRSRREV